MSIVGIELCARESLQMIAFGAVGPKMRDFPNDGPSLAEEDDSL